MDGERQAIARQTAQHWASIGYGRDPMSPAYQDLIHPDCEVMAWRITCWRDQLRAFKQRHDMELGDQIRDTLDDLARTIVRRR